MTAKTRPTGRPDPLAYLEDEVAALRERHLYRRLRIMSSSQGPIWTFSDNLTWIKGRHNLKGGAFVEYSGEDDFDQINVNATPGGTNNQNGLFDFTDRTISGQTQPAIASAALGLFTNYAELGQRNFTQWRALATDV